MRDLFLKTHSERNRRSSGVGFFKARMIYPLLGLLLLAACGDGGANPAGTTSVGVTLSLPSSGASASSPAGFRPRASAPTGIGSVSLTATDAGGTVLAETRVSASAGETVRITLDVPTGPRRVLIAQAFDPDGVLLFRGKSEPVDLVGGAPVSLSIQVVFVTVSVSPPSAAVLAGGSQSFSATVSGLDDPSVRWMVNGIPGGNLSVGTITQENPAVYTAPSTVPEAAVQITAVSTADPTKSAAVNVTILPLEQVVFVSPNGADSPECGSQGSPCRTITQGLNRSKAGDTVLAGPGEYSDEPFPITTKPDVLLIGSDDFRSIIKPNPLSNGFNAPLVIMADRSTLSGFVLDGGEGIAEVLIQTDSGSSVISNNILRDIELIGTTGIRIDGGSPVIVGNEFFGFQVLPDVDAGAIEIYNDATPVITSGSNTPNRFHDNFYGIVAFDASAGVIDGNIFTNNDTGILVRDGATPLIRGNVLTDNQFGAQARGFSDPDLGGGAQGSDGGNTLSCNTEVDLRFNTTNLFAQNNFWDHVPPTQSFQSGIGIDLIDDGEGGVDFSGAQLVALSCNQESIVFVSLVGTERTDIGGVTLTIDYDESLVSYVQGSAVAINSAAGALVEETDDGKQLVIGMISVTGMSTTDVLSLKFQNVNGRGLPVEASYPRLPFGPLDVTDVTGNAITGLDTSIRIVNK